MGDLRREKLLGYIKSQSRNKIVIHSDQIPGVVTINLGLQLSEALYNIDETKHFSNSVLMKVDKMLNAAISSHTLFGPYLSVANLGILFEPELKLDFLRLLDNHSKNNVLFVKWEGEIDLDSLYFLSKENGIKTIIKNLSHIVI